MVKDFDKERAHETFRKMIQTDRLHRCVMEKFFIRFFAGAAVAIIVGFLMLVAILAVLVIYT